MIKAPKNADKYYIQGLEFEKQEKYQDAYYNFGKISKFSKIYPLALYKQAKCAKILQDNKTAIKKYEKYNSKVNNEIMSPVGLWELGNLYYEIGKFNDALKIFKKIEKKYPDNNYTYASYFRMGEILQKKNKSTSNEYFIKYLSYAPLGRFSKKAISYLEENETLLSDDSKLVLINSLIQNEEYNKSASLLNKVTSNKKWVEEYKLHKAINNTTQALQIIEKGISSSTKDIKDDEIKAAINYYLSKKSSKDDIKKIYEITNQKGNNAHFYIGIKYAQSLKDNYQLYEDLYKCNSKYSDIFLSEMIYLSYKNNNYTKAIELGNEYYSKYKNETTAPKALYYTAKAHEKNGNKSQANSLYKNIIDNYFKSYYAFRSYQMLNKNPSFNISVKYELPKKPDIKFNFSYDDKTNYFLNKLVEFEDTETIDDFKIQDEFLKSWLAHKSKKHSYSLLLARDEADKTTNKLTKNQAMLLYPIYYEDDINKYSKMNNVSPFLIISLVRKESHFDTSAKSSAGAIGLMQILPTTASFVEKGNVTRNINDISYNIYLGTKYFSYLKSTLKGNDMLSVASYNAGPGNVKKWLNELNTKDYDIFVESIPYIETKSYVKKVFEAYWNYINLYK